MIKRIFKGEEKAKLFKNKSQISKVKNESMRKVILLKLLCLVCISNCFAQDYIILKGNKDTLRCYIVEDKITSIDYKSIDNKDTTIYNIKYKQYECYIRNIISAEDELKKYLPYAPEILLRSSVGYTNTYRDYYEANPIVLDDSTGYPEDLKNSGLFFIVIGPGEIGRKPLLTGPKSTTINSDLIYKMEIKYPFKFKYFSSEYRSENKEYFIEQGYRYRLLIQMNWIQYYSNEWNRFIWKQNFSIAIQDLQTDKIYGTTRWQYFGNYQKKFFQAIKKYE